MEKFGAHPCPPALCDLVRVSDKQAASHTGVRRLANERAKPGVQASGQVQAAEMAACQRAGAEMPGRAPLRRVIAVDV